MAEFDPYYELLGIPAWERPLTKYRLLGISKFEDNPQVISRAAEARTMFLRSMQMGEHVKVITQLLNEVAAARITLLDPNSRKEYNLSLGGDPKAITANDSLEFKEEQNDGSTLSSESDPVRPSNIKNQSIVPQGQIALDARSKQASMINGNSTAVRVSKTNSVRQLPAPPLKAHKTMPYRRRSGWSRYQTSEASPLDDVRWLKPLILVSAIAGFGILLLISLSILSSPGVTGSSPKTAGTQGSTYSGMTSGDVTAQETIAGSAQKEYSTSESPKKFVQSYVFEHEAIVSDVALVSSDTLVSVSADGIINTWGLHGFERIGTADLGAYNNRKFSILHLAKTTKLVIDDRWYYGHLYDASTSEDPSLTERALEGIAEMESREATGELLFWVYDFESNELTKDVFKGFPFLSQLVRLSVSLDGRFIVAAGSDVEGPLLRLFKIDGRTNSFDLLGGLGGVKEPVWNVSVSANNMIVATGGSDKIVRCREFATGKLLSSFEMDDYVETLALNKTGTCVATAGRFQKVINIRELSDVGGRFALEGHEWPVTALTFSPDGRYLASGGQDKVIRIWDLQNEREVENYVGHTGNITKLVFSSDGQRLFSGSDDKTVRVWDRP